MDYDVTPLEAVGLNHTYTNHGGGVMEFRRGGHCRVLVYLDGGCVIEGGLTKDQVVELGKFVSQIPR